MLLDRGGRRRRNLEPSDAFDNDTEIIGTPSRPNLRRAEAASEIEAKKTQTRSTTNFVATTTKEASPEELQPNHG
jgi:hypothetical protein